MHKTDDDITGDIIQVDYAGRVAVSQVAQGQDRDRVANDYLYFIDTAIKSTRLIEFTTKEGEPMYAMIYMN